MDNDIFHVKEIVKGILKKEPLTRTNDSLLYMRVLEVWEFSEGESVLDLPLHIFLSNIPNYCCPGIETVSRARRKVQAEFPELRDPETDAARIELAKTFRAFALEGG